MVVVMVYLPSISTCRSTAVSGMLGARFPLSPSFFFSFFFFSLFLMEGRGVVCGREARAFVYMYVSVVRKQLGRAWSRCQDMGEGGCAMGSSCLEASPVTEGSAERVIWCGGAFLERSVVVDHKRPASKHSLPTYIELGRGVQVGF